jgi:hypothetical protein
VEAKLSGADFRGADFSGVKFCGADLSRANLSGAKGLNEKMLADACAGSPMEEKVMKADPELAVDEEAQPVGIEIFGKDFRIPRCASEKICQQ